MDEMFVASRLKRIVADLSNSQENLTALAASLPLETKCQGQEFRAGLKAAIQNLFLVSGDLHLAIARVEPTASVEIPDRELESLRERFRRERSPGGEGS